MRTVVERRRSEPGYPGMLEILLGDDAPPGLEILGDPGLLDEPMIALFCSRRCTGAAATRTYDVVQRLRDMGRIVAGGWQSPMERVCLDLLLKSPNGVVAGLARTLRGARLPSSWRAGAEAGRLTIVSALGSNVRRVTRETAAQRNLILALLASRVFVAHCEPGSATAAMCERLLHLGKPLFSLAGADIVQMGVNSHKIVDVNELAKNPL